MTTSASASPSFFLSFVRGWDRFWFRPADPTTLCLIRVFAGLLILYVHISYSWRLLDFVGPNGWLDARTADWVLRNQEIYTLPTTWEGTVVQVDQGNYYWSPFFHITDTRWIVGLHVFFLVSMALFTLGLWTRYTSLLSWIGAMAYVQRAAVTVFGMDTMMMIVLFYLMIGPSGATFSLDRWLEKRRALRLGLPIPAVQPSALANFAIRLIQVHFCIVYLAGGTSKLQGSTWWGGTALNLVVLNYSFAPLDSSLYMGILRFLAQHRWLWEIAIGSGIVFTLVLEVGFPFLVWFRETRWVFVCGSIMLHTGIALIMGLVAFSLFMLVMVLSFVPPEMVQQVLARVTSGKKPPAPDASPPAPRKELVLARN